MDLLGAFRAPSRVFGCGPMKKASKLWRLVDLALLLLLQFPPSGLSFPPAEAIFLGNTR